jgi:hypothetical protein
VLSAIADRTVHVGTLLRVTNTATDIDIPANALSFSLATNAPAGAAIDSLTGILTWTPVESQITPTNLFTVRVTDNGAPNLFDEKSFNVAVVSRPVIQSISLSNEVVTIIWSAIAGGKYRLQHRETLGPTNWIDLPPDVTAAGPTASRTDLLGLSQRFYRVQVVP